MVDSFSCGLPDAEASCSAHASPLGCHLLPLIAPMTLSLCLLQNAGIDEADNTLLLMRHTIPALFSSPLTVAGARSNEGQAMQRQTRKHLGSHGKQ